jgi:hypothetical protein
MNSQNLPEIASGDRVIPWTSDPAAIVATKLATHSMCIERDSVTGVQMEHHVYTLPTNMRFLMEAFPGPDGIWQLSTWPLPQSSKIDPFRADYNPMNDLAVMAIRLTTDPYVTSIQPEDARTSDINRLRDDLRYYDYRGLDVGIDLGAEVVQKVILNYIQRLTRRIAYSHVADFLPGVELRNVTYNRSASGSWDGYRFALNAKGRKCFLRVWDLPQENGYPKPTWEACVELSQPKPFFEQFSGLTHESAMAAALILTSRTLSVIPGAPEVEVPTFVVPDDPQISQALNRVIVISSTPPQSRS